MSGISIPLYSTVMDGMESAVKEVADSEKAINTARYFIVEKNRSRPEIEDVNRKAIVNILLDKVETDTERSTKHLKIHKATYHFDMYAKGDGKDMSPADEVAAIRLHLLTAQVEYGITAMKNARFGLQVGQIDGSIETFLQFFSSEDSKESTSIFAPARFIMICYFPYYPAGLENLPDLDTVDIKLLEDWNLQFDYTS